MNMNMNINIKDVVCTMNAYEDHPYYGGEFTRSLTFIVTADLRKYCDVFVGILDALVVPRADSLKFAEHSVLSIINMSGNPEDLWSYEVPEDHDYTFITPETIILPEVSINICKHNHVAEHHYYGTIRGDFSALREPIKDFVSRHGLNYEVYPQSIVDLKDLHDKFLGCVNLSGKGIVYYGQEQY